MTKWREAALRVLRDHAISQRRACRLVDCPAGQQVVRVERVTVNEGGQAIVGNVATGGAGTWRHPHAKRT